MCVCASMGTFQADPALIGGSRPGGGGGLCSAWVLQSWTYIVAYTSRSLHRAAWSKHKKRGDACFRWCVPVVGINSFNSMHTHKVGQNHIYAVCTRYFWQGNHQIYGHIRYVYTVLANPTYSCILRSCIMPGTYPLQRSQYLLAHASTVMQTRTHPCASPRTLISLCARIHTHDCTFTANAASETAKTQRLKYLLLGTHAHTLNPP